MGIIYRDPEDSFYDEAEFSIVKGNTVHGDYMDDIRFFGELPIIREGIEKIHEALPDYKYVPMRDVREAMYPEKMNTEQLERHWMRSQKLLIRMNIGIMWSRERTRYKR